MASGGPLASASVIRRARGVGSSTGYFGRPVSRAWHQLEQLPHVHFNNINDASTNPKEQYKTVNGARFPSAMDIFYF